MSGDKFIVITSINAPGEAIRGFAQWPGWQTVVVGDRKTPANWASNSVTYLDIDKQHDLFGDLSRSIPENTYTRKMIGYAYAMSRGAVAIFESDDDNIPYCGAASIVEKVMAGLYHHRHDRRKGQGHWLNAYRLFGADRCWPRGLPLEYIENIREKFNPVELGKSEKSWAVMQFLADEDPDVDAIYRITKGGIPVYFAQERTFLIDEGTFSPINSQATLWLPPAFPAMFLPIGVSDRVADILRGFIAQAAIWNGGHIAGVSSPVVYQKRNPHDLRKDFADEVQLYINASEWGRMLLEIYETSVPDAFRKALSKLVQRGFIPTENIGLYESFLSATGQSK